MTTCSCKEINKTLSSVRILEFYSGIGGIHYAFHVAGIAHEVVAAVDINTVVNEIYCYNFRGTKCLQRNIQSFTAEEINEYQPDIITMSPPCQPFTRVGLKQDSEDPRAESFLHILDIIKLCKKPSYFLLENVKGFENSDTRNTLVQTLQECGYLLQEFLLSPSQFGIPNSRLRYYILAKLQPLQFPFPVSEQIKSKLPLVNEMPWKFRCKNCEECKNCVDTSDEILSLHHFLQNKPETYFDPFLVSDKILEKHAMVLDIVNKNSNHSCCFTKAYGHYAQGTGSVLHTQLEYKVDDIYENAFKTTDKCLQLELLKKLKLRYFTPKEVANIMCFPSTFRFPELITTKQKYRVLGNSVNVFVVSALLQLLLTDAC